MRQRDDANTDPEYVEPVVQLGAGGEEAVGGGGAGRGERLPRQCVHVEEPPVAQHLREGAAQADQQLAGIGALRPPAPLGGDDRGNEGTRVAEPRRRPRARPAPLCEEQVPLPRRQVQTPQLVRHQIVDCAAHGAAETNGQAETRNGHKKQQQPKKEKQQKRRNNNKRTRTRHASPRSRCRNLAVRREAGTLRNSPRATPQRSAHTSRTARQ